MQKYFQNIFIDPIEKTNLTYKGTVKDEKWEEGVLKSQSKEWKVKDGIPYFDTDEAGDQFPQELRNEWLNTEALKNEWEGKIKYNNDVFRTICDEVASLNRPVMDVASGPGLGLLPKIITINPEIYVLATDACSTIVKAWKQYLKRQNLLYNINFAQFDARYMPIKSNSIDVITSNGGFTSIRSNNKLTAIKEAYRVLKSGGYIFAIEGQYDIAGLELLYKKMGKNFLKEQSTIYDMTWKERFEEAGFKIKEEKLERKIIIDENWWLGKEAKEYGIELWTTSKAYIVYKS